MLVGVKKEFENLENTNSILIAVSGGVDSMVLWHLIHSLKIKHGIAHVNFCLREEESSIDEALVRDQAKEWGVPFHSMQVDTELYAEEKGLSIQMAAREIRYDFFEKLLDKEEYDVLATAHHLQDNIETFLINLNRGTGVKGLAGIQSNQHRFRPLLNYSKEEIRAYANENQVRFREDASNSDSKYERNWFRHQIVKPWQEHNPNFLQQMKGNFQRIQETNELFYELLNDKTKNVQAQLNEGSVELESLIRLGLNRLMMHFLFASYGFNQSQLDDLVSCIQEEKVGKQFFSDTYSLNLDRKQLFLTQNKMTNSKTDFWEVGVDVELEQPIFIQTKLHERNRFFFVVSTLMEGFDADTLSFPLQLRRWKEGDKMMPMGMSNMKKVSDILIDEKIPLNQKEDVFVLTSEEEIVWLVGIRPDERFKVREWTQNVLEVSTK